MVLDDPTVEAAVLETARGGIVRRGLGYEAADVAVVTNISADHLGADCIDDLDELIHVKALVAEEIRTGGSVVLNADDPATASLASRQAVLAHAPVIRMFSTAPGSAIIEEHKAAGGICYEMLDGQLVETVMGTRHSLLAVDEMPGAFGGKAKHVIANALAALAACRALGVTVEDCKRGLATFTPGELNPGRGNVYRTATSPVIVDYGHNAAALAATGQFVNEAWGGQLVAAMTLPGDRRDDLLVQSANAVAAWFGKVVLYEDSDKRGRKTGEMLELVGDALHAARPDITCVHAENPADALRTALRLADGGPVLFVYEKLGMAHDALAAVDAVPWPEASCPVLDIAKAAEAVVADAALAARSPADASADYNAGGTMPGSASTAVRSARAASSARKVSAAARPRR
jgi:cyanophycin synthetase